MNVKKINHTLLFVLFVILLASLYSILQIQSFFPEPKPLPKITLTIITCENCVKIQEAENFVKQLNTVQLEETKTFDMKEAADLIKKHEIKRVPAAIITGDIDELEIQNFEKRGAALIVDNVPAPYYDTQTNELKGLIKATVIKGCEQCTDVLPMLEQLKQFGVAITETKEYEEKEAKEIIKKYSIKKLPTIIFSKEASDYEIFEQIWEQVGTIEEDGSFVMREINPPYQEEGTVKGLLTLTMLTDKTCKECYNVSLQKQIFKTNFGVGIGKENILDINTETGKKIVKKYKITKVPTTILSQGAKEYKSLTEIWEQAGTIEEDGSYIFRNVELLKITYKDLEKNEVVNVS